MWSPQQRSFLGITKKEHALLRLLQKSPLNTSEIALRARFPRVTVLRHLTTLWKRGFVARNKAAREVRWSLVSQKLLRKRLELDAMGERSISGQRIPLSDIASVSVYQGAAEMFASNQKILAAHAGERLYCIEPNAIWRHVVKIPATEWVHLNTLLIQKQIIAEVVVEQGFEEVLKEYVEDVLSESFFALAKDVRVMRKGSMPAAVETLIFRDQVLLLDWEQFVGVEITSASIVKILKGLFLELQRNSRPIEISVVRSET